MRLGVNVDHVATLRQARRGHLPDPVAAAQTCERAGATGIVCHLREDRRHIQDQDVRRLQRTLGIPFNLEMSMAQDVVRIALEVRPAQVTLVPERREELTTEGGLDVVRQQRKLRRMLATFSSRKIPVSLFVDPDEPQLDAAKAIGASRVELHTGRYADAGTARRRATELKLLEQAARSAADRGMDVAAGHGLDYANVCEVAVIPEIQELNIGYSIITRALVVGLETAVREMAALLGSSRVTGRARERVPPPVLGSARGGPADCLSAAWAPPPERRDQTARWWGRQVGG